MCESKQLIISNQLRLSILLRSKLAYYGIVYDIEKTDEDEKMSLRPGSVSDTLKRKKKEKTPTLQDYIIIFFLDFPSPSCLPFITRSTELRS